MSPLKHRVLVMLGLKGLKHEVVKYEPCMNVIIYVSGSSSSCHFIHIRSEKIVSSVFKMLCVLNLESIHYFLCLNDSFCICGSYHFYWVFLFEGRGGTFIP